MTDEIKEVSKSRLPAEAREYRESLAIEKAINKSPARREVWIKQQLEKAPVDAFVYNGGMGREETTMQPEPQ